MLKYNYVFFNIEEGNKRRRTPDGYNTICVADLEKMSNVEVVSYPVDYAPHFIRVLFSLHHTPKINRFIKLPFKSLWYPFYFKNKFENTKPICFIVSDSYLPLGYLRYLKKKYPECRCVKYHRDLIKFWEEKNPQYTKDVINEVFDLRITYDEEEAKKYGILYIGEIESKISVPRSADYPISDVFFAAKAKDRLDKILEVYDVLSSNGLNCDFYITGVPEEKQIDLLGVKYARKSMTYREMLYRTANTRCVLEINQEGTVGFTSRFLEAVIYNKKLLTNNATIKNTKFYDKKYIQCFDKPADIDTSFVKADVGTIDYHYNGEFSPIRIIEKIEEKILRLDAEEAKE